MREKTLLVRISRILLVPAITVFALIVVATVSAATVRAQVLGKPRVYKNQIIIPMPNLAIMDLFEGNTPTSVYVQIGNTGSANAGIFWVKLSLKKKGSTDKTYVEKRVERLDAKLDLPLYIDVGQPIADLEIGVFIDSRNQVKESNENNCGKLYPGGAVSGVEPCKGF